MYVTWETIGMCFPIQMRDSGARDQLHFSSAHPDLRNNGIIGTKLARIHKTVITFGRDYKCNKTFVVQVSVD